MKQKQQERRDFLKVLGAGSVSLGLADHSWAKDSKRPNILWITCEDISPHLGCYGDPHATTPALDRLAREGIRYTNAYAVAGVCAPCRSCIITGVYQTSLGSQHMRCRVTLPEQIKCFPEYLRRAGYYCTNNSKTDYQFPVPKTAWDESSKKAHFRNRPRKEQPFFAVFNFTTTHESKIANESAHQSVTQRLKPEQRVDPAALTTLPPYYPDTPVTRRDWARNYDNITAMDMQVADILKQLEEDGLADDTIVFFFSDHGVGLPRAKRWLYDSGLHVPMIVRIPQQFRLNGQGQPGTVTDELVSFVDLAPTVLNLAGVEIPDYMQGRAFLGDHLSPPRTYIYGARDRMDERYDIIRAVRDKRYKYIRNYEPFKTYYQYMNTPEKGATMQEIRRLAAEGKLPPAAQKYMAPTKPLEELYDVDNDPHELHNLADSPAHQAILIRMRQAHVAWVQETKDLGFIPEPEMRFRAKKYGSEYNIARQKDGDSFIQRTLAAARLPEKGLAGLEALLKAMNDEDAAVRYWGAIGLGNLGTRAAKTIPVLEKSLNDPSDCVRFASARALCLMNQPKQALHVLQTLLKSEQEWTRLNAAIILDSIGDMARPAIPDLKSAMADKNKYVVRVVNHTLNVLEGTNNKVR